MNFDRHRDSRWCCVYPQEPAGSPGVETGAPGARVGQVGVGLLVAGGEAFCRLTRVPVTSTASMFTRVPPDPPAWPVQESTTLCVPDVRVPVVQTFCWRSVVGLEKSIDPLVDPVEADHGLALGDAGGGDEVELGAAEPEQCLGRRVGVRVGAAGGPARAEAHPLAQVQDVAVGLLVTGDDPGSAAVAAVPL